MSGPKRSDVQKVLDDAELTEGALKAAVAESVLSRLATALSRASSTGKSPLDDAARDLGRSRADVVSVGAARSAIDGARSAQKAAASAAATARDEHDAAARLTADARRAGDKARAALAEAQSVLNNSIGDHNKQREMGIARAAVAELNKAVDIAKSANSAQQKAQRCLSEAITVARQANDAAVSATARAQAAVRESAERTRAEEEARRIAEEARREATVAVENARAAVDGLPAADCDKFAPGERTQLTTSLTDAQRKLDDGASGPARKTAESVSAAVPSLSSRVVQARAEFDRKRAVAQTAVDELDATVRASDRELIGEWSETPHAYDEGATSLESAKAALAAENFDEAARLATAHRTALSAATATAAKNAAADERRQSIGDSIMDVLEEMGFDISCQAGTKDEPLRIAGATSDQSGKGDVVMAIPIDGEVDFEVIAKEGDGSCSAVIAGLRQRLADRGVQFEVTDWGYGHDPRDLPRVSDVERETEADVEREVERHR